MVKVKSFFAENTREINEKIAKIEQGMTDKTKILNVSICPNEHGWFVHVVTNTEV